MREMKCNNKSSNNRGESEWEMQLAAETDDDCKPGLPFPPWPCPVWGAAPRHPPPLAQSLGCTYRNRRFGVGFQIARDRVKATTKLAKRTTGDRRSGRLGSGYHVRYNGTNSQGFTVTVAMFGLRVRVGLGFSGFRVFGFFGFLGFRILGFFFLGLVMV